VKPLQNPQTDLDQIAAQRWPSRATPFRVHNLAGARPANGQLAGLLLEEILRIQLAVSSMRGQVAELGLLCALQEAEAPSYAVLTLVRPQVAP
jgi:hypothetical protein